MKTFAELTEPELIGRQLGDYRITGLLGEGGMGQVYRAERSDGRFQREVAIKVSAAGGISQNLRERFFREQEILAGMQHPGVAQLYDAGVSEEGWPFIVMELVEGESIDVYVDARQPNIRQLIHMFINIVEAVAFAHARLIVHRDIKPSNVMVDDSGNPRLLDFGIAKLLAQEETELSEIRPMTLTYASPEQLLGQPITIGSDIYQLGLLAHRLVLGRLPFSNQDLAQAIARATDARPFRLAPEQRRSLPREVADIISRCLQPDVSERYRDANALRDDLQRYLEGRPVLATRPSAGYRIRKFLLRNRAASLIATVSLVTVISGVVLYTWQLTEARNEAERESQTSTAVVDFLVQTYRSPDPNSSQGADITARQMLDAGLVRIDEELSNQPEIQARLRFTLGDILQRLGESDQAVQALGSARRYYLSTVGPSDRKTLLTENALVGAMRYTSDLDGAIAMAQGALTKLTTKGDPDNGLRLELLQNLGAAHTRSGDFDAALNYYAAARKLTTGEDARAQQLRLAANMGHLYNLKGEPGQSVALLEPLLAECEEVVGHYHPLTSDLMANLAHGYYLQEENDKAEPLFSAISDIRQQIYGPTHAETLKARANLASFLRTKASMALEAGADPESVTPDFERAATLMAEVYNDTKKSLGATHGDTLQAQQNFALTLLHVERFDEAINLLLENQRLVKSELPPGHQAQRDVLRFLGYSYFMAGKLGDAKPVIAQALEDARAHYGEDYLITRELLDLSGQIDEALSTDLKPGSGKK